MRSRRLTAAAAIVLMVFVSLQPVHALAAQGYLEVELKLDEEGEMLFAGDVIHVRLFANQPVNLFGIEFTLTYSPQQLELLSEEEDIYNDDVFSDPWYRKADKAAGNVTFALTTFDVNGVTANQLEIAQLAFEIRQSGSISIALTNVKAVVADGLATPEIPVNSAGGLVFQVARSLDLIETEVWLDLEDRRTYQLNADASPADMPLYWHSCHPDVVTVDQEGRLTAAAPGIAAVTVTDDAYASWDDLCGETGGGSQRLMDAVVVWVGTIIRVEWDEAAWRQDSLADLPVMVPIGGDFFMAFTNDEGEAMFPLQFSGEAAFFVGSSAGQIGGPIIQSSAHRVVFDPNIPQTKSGIVRVLPLKAPGSDPEDAFGITDVLWFIDHWDLAGRDFDLNGVTDRNDRKALLQRIPPVVTSLNQPI
jgi:hypothetical protein